VQGQATDIEIHAREILRIKSVLNDILVHHTGQPRERINEDTDRDRFMTPQEAKTYGLIDEVIVSRDGRRATIGDTPEKSTDASSA
jgi:ATP-dependent Clp protease protease subunit